MKSWDINHRHHQRYPQKEYYSNKRRADDGEAEKNSVMKNLEEEVENVKSRLNILEGKYEELYNTSTASLEEIKKRLDLMDENFVEEATKNFRNLQNMNLSDLKKLENVVDGIKSAIDYYKGLEKLTVKVDEKEEVSTNPNPTNISVHSEFTLDEHGRAIVYVRSKIFKVGKHQKAAFGIWWAAGHEANSSRVLRNVLINDENDINLRAFIHVMETAVRYRMQHLCIISDSKYIVDRMIKAQFEKNKNDFQWKVLSTHPTDRENLFLYACDMMTWFYDIKWSYFELPCKMPGMMDAWKLIDNF